MDFSKPKVLIDLDEYNHLKQIDNQIDNNMYQICPVCKGDKKMLNVPEPIGNVSPLYYGTKICTTCNGTGIISQLTGLPPKAENHPLQKDKSLFDAFIKDKETNLAGSDYDIDNNFNKAKSFYKNVWEQIIKELNKEHTEKLFEITKKVYEEIEPKDTMLRGNKINSFTPKTGLGVCNLKEVIYNNPNKLKESDKYKVTIDVLKHELENIDVFNHLHHPLNIILRNLDITYQDLIKNNK